VFASLDENGRLDELPFMPEMLQFCGKTFQVSSRAHKTCDPAIGVEGRKMANAVHLNLRCDGSAHDGCQARCLIFWKEAWLERVEDPVTESPKIPQDNVSDKNARHIEEVLRSKVKASPAGDATNAIYTCQNTQIKFATQTLKWWDLRQYVEDYTSGNVSLWRLAAGLTYSIWRTLAEAGIGIGSPMRWIYDRYQRLVGGAPYPIRPFGVPKGVQTPKFQLDLKQGEPVRVKRFQEILNTLDHNYRNRGLYFDPEMVPFTEGVYEVDYRVGRIIDERTCKMVVFKSDAIVLKGVKCESRYAICRRFCPRAIYPYWREIWLERTSQGD